MYQRYDIQYDTRYVEQQLVLVCEALPAYPYTSHGIYGAIGYTAPSCILSKTVTFIPLKECIVSTHRLSCPAPPPPPQ